MGKLNESRFHTYENNYNNKMKNFIKQYGENITLDFSDFSKLQPEIINIESIPIYYENHYSKPEYVFII